MFVSQNLEPSPFDFDIVLDDKVEETFSSELQEDDFPDDILHKDESILCYSSRGSHKKNYDQFDYIIKEDFILAAIYDGHGGPSVSLYLKQNLLKTISNHELFESNPTQALSICISQIDEQVMQKFQQNQGSTLIVVLWRKQYLYVVNIGDGVCYGFAQDTEVQLQDKFHVAVGEQSIRYKDALFKKREKKGTMLRKKILNQVHNLEIQQERKKVKAKGGLILRQKNSYRVDGQLNLSRSIGDKKYKQWITAIPSIKKYKQNFSHLLIASDGFCQILHSVKIPEQANQLIENHPYLKDNATLMLISKPLSFQQKQLTN